MSKLRIGLLGMRHESMVRSPFLTPFSAFTITRGQAIIDDKLWSMRGAVTRFQEDDEVELVPLVFARAWPGGWSSV